jgi:hypothetical protein
MGNSYDLDTVQCTKYMYIFLLDGATMHSRVMEESGAQCIVVFALIFTEPTSECVCLWRRGLLYPPPPATSQFVTIYATTTMHCSRFFHEWNIRILSGEQENYNPLVV